MNTNYSQGTNNELQEKETENVEVNEEVMKLTVV